MFLQIPYHFDEKCDILPLFLLENGFHNLHYL